MPCTMSFATNLFLFAVLILFQSLVLVTSDAPADCKTDSPKGRQYPDIKYDLDPGAYTKEGLQAARKAGLERHNYWRKFHGAPPMTLSDELNDHAQHAAECCVKWGKMFHTISSYSLGENLGDMGASKDATKHVIEAVDMWYAEYCDGTTDPKDKRGEVVKGHFTQVVWKNSVQLGIGVAQSTLVDGRQRAIVVGRYSPGGNWKGETDAQVGPLIGMSDAEMCCRAKIPKGRNGKLRSQVKKGEEGECTEAPVGLGAKGAAGKKSMAQMVVAIGLFPFLMG